MTLSYNDCLELRENGFPQLGTDPGQYSWPEGGGLDFSLAAYIPTLEELIAECLGDRLDFYLNNSTLTVHWSAGMNGHVGNGSTPSQAVKTLYCALNPKK